MIIFSVYFIIKHLFLCVKQTSLKDVSLRIKTYVLIDSHSNSSYIGPISYSSISKIYFEQAGISKNQIPYFRGIAVY